MHSDIRKSNKTDHVTEIDNLSFFSEICYTYTFEDGIKDLYQDSRDNFDWTVGQAYTQSIKTGPSFDHTLFNGEGRLKQL